MSGPAPPSVRFYNPPERLVWSFPWDATEGRHELLSRATADSGNIQPLEPIWNVKGVANNACQRVIVHVRPDVTD